MIENLLPPIIIQMAQNMVRYRKIPTVFKIMMHKSVQFHRTFYNITVVPCINKLVCRAGTPPL